MTRFLFHPPDQIWKTVPYQILFLVFLVQRLSSTRREILFFITTSGFACQTWEQLFPAAGCVAAGASVAEAGVPVGRRNLRLH